MKYKSLFLSLGIVKKIKIVIMNLEIKELLENNMIVEELKNDLCEIIDIEERIKYLEDLKVVIDVLIKEECVK